MRLCSVENCGRASQSKGFCPPHYERLKNYGSVNAENPIRIKTGRTKNPLYQTWSDMKDRCYNINNKFFHRYGGRGITICDRWRYSLDNFVEDMGERPFAKAELDRIDNNGNYEPSNCRWVSHAENNRNKSTVKLTDIDVQYIRNSSLKNYQLATLFNVDRTTISGIRLNKTWKC